MHMMLLGSRNSEQVPVAEDVVGVDVVLDGFEHPHADVGDGVPHPPLPKFPHWVTEKRNK